MHYIYWNKNHCTFISTYISTWIICVFVECSLIFSAYFIVVCVLCYCIFYCIFVLQVIFAPIYWIWQKPDHKSNNPSWTNPNTLLPNTYLKWPRSEALVHTVNVSHRVMWGICHLSNPSSCSSPTLSTLSLVLLPVTASHLLALMSGTFSVDRSRQEFS